MVKRTNLADAVCPIARSLDAVGDGWSLLIIRDALLGKRRFSEFQRSLGLARNILAARLRKLTAHGILQSVPAPAGGAHREYVLTPKGQALFPVLVALRQWGDDFLFAPGEASTTLIDRQTGRPVRRLEVHAQDGRRLEPTDTLVTAG